MKRCLQVLALVVNLAMSGCAPMDASDPAIGPSADVPPDRVNTTPDELQQAQAVAQWASNVPILALVHIEQAESERTEPKGEIATSAVLRILDVLRDDDGADLSIGDRVWMDVPGGQIGVESMVTSAAPLLFADDEALVGLRITEDGLAFAGNFAALPTQDGQLHVCVNPTPDALYRCLDANAGLVVAPGLPAFTEPDFAAPLSLDTLFEEIR